MKLYNLFCRTEYSFKTAFGQPSKVLAAGGVGICDRSGTWGHIQFFEAAKKLKTPIVLGVEIPVTDKSDELRPALFYYRFLARTSAGLQRIYEITTESTRDDKGRLTRLAFSDIDKRDVVIVAPSSDARKAPRDCYVAITQGSIESDVSVALDRGLSPLAGSDNLYPRPEHYGAYEITSGRFKESQSKNHHILTLEEYLAEVPWAPRKGIENTEKLYKEIAGIPLPVAEMVKYTSKKSLRDLCMEGVERRRMGPIFTMEYRERLQRELKLIQEKKFEDYFFVLADMIGWAKERMMVGPARGSSCGSLVCYLTGITDIDPIHYGLLFERFIDTTRADLPDIDVDFQDNKRELVFEYIRKKYGSERVARIGTISRYKSDSAINEVAKMMRIPIKDTQALKAATLKRSSGDARAMLCIADTFTENTVGKEFIKKYPEMIMAAEIEEHASHTGQHAAGIAITQHPITNYCSVDLRTGVAQLDWHDAVVINLLKIDALGLRTLSVIEDCLSHIKKDARWLLDYPLDDKKAFDVINKRKFTGIFQFEGQAVEGLCRQMKIETIEDVIALTALARPGPLVSGSAGDFVNVRTGKKPIKYLHPLAKPMTEVTHGTVIYQEQVMRLGREIGGLSWEDVNALRRGMGKSLGKEYFNKFYPQFLKGAKAKGMNEEESQHVWDHMCTMGSYGFNRSHAAAYGTVSYWCCVLKSKHPLEYAAAQLRNSKGDDSTTLILRELVKEGFKYIPVDIKKSGMNWEVHGKTIYGGLTNISGVGEVAAKKIIEGRDKQGELPPALLAKTKSPVTPFDNIFEAESKFMHFYDDPEANKIGGHVWRIGEIIEEVPRKDVVLLGKLKTKNVRDANENISVQKRGGRILEGQTLALNFRLADDTGLIQCRIKATEYLEMALPIVDTGVLDEDWYMVRGRYAPAFGMFFVEKVRNITKEAKDES